jgi:ABC-2 type transport system ATP-binding protein
VSISPIVGDEISRMLILCIRPIDGGGANSREETVAECLLEKIKSPDTLRRVISVQQLTKRFAAQLAVDSLSFEVPAGQIVGFLGPNGAGKSTTLKMLTGMIEPTAGTATVCGLDLLRDTLELKRRIGFVPESGAVFESLTGLEYLEMVAALYGIPEAAARERIRQFIAFFELSFETLTDKLLGAYSKGMRRKVVITAALLHNPPVVFFDEPLDGLDANAAVGFKALIQTLAREGKTIVYSSHILDVVERVCDRVIIIDKGKLIADGRPDQLVAERNAGSLERLFTELTGGTELQRRAEDFAKTFRP